MTTETKTIISTSLYTFCIKLQEHVQNGWEIDPNNYPSMFGIAYESGLIKKDKIPTVGDIVITSKPKDPQAVKKLDKIAS